MIWRCPACRGTLARGENGLRCDSCGSRYESIAGIPDLRVDGASWIDYEADKAQALRLAEAETAGCDAQGLVRLVFGSRPGWDSALIELRARQVMTAPHRLRADINGWLHDATSAGGLFLDVGCGPGTLLAAGAAEGRAGVGIDVSLTWLIVARRILQDWGGQPVVAAALAEAVPLADASVSAVVSLDMLEHAAEPGRCLSEMDRITRPGGRIALSTPNRYSLAAEPHVFVWGVGWLPRSAQKHYVRWRSGKSYESTRLLSVREASRLVRRHTRFEFEITIPLVPEEEIAYFAAYRAALARLYNRLVSFGWTHWLFRCIGPFFRVVGKKKEQSFDAR